MSTILKASEIKDWDAGAIVSKISECRRELFEVKMQQAATALEKPHRIKILKKNIARLMTAKNFKGDK